MRWLLLKDLQILRRSPLVTALLVIYPVAIAVLIGFALSDEGGKPRVAFLNQVPDEEQFKISGGEEELDRGIARDQLCKRVECVAVSSREEAEQKVADGEIVFTGSAAELHGAVPDSDGRDFEAAFVRFLRERGH